ncbi:MAG: hypothetical protein ACSHWW_12865 [Nonlabens sp.]|uniref:hypothetical protein n=1 Tax=Nonlabens sp. TaxID=1888209 RepID=UPI003EF6D007
MDYFINIAGTLVIGAALAYIFYWNFLKVDGIPDSKEIIEEFDLSIEQNEFVNYLENVLVADEVINKSVIVSFNAFYVQYAVFSKTNDSSGYIYCEALSEDFEYLKQTDIKPNFNLLLKNGFEKHQDIQSNYFKDYNCQDKTQVDGIIEELLNIMEKVYCIPRNNKTIAEVRMF